MVNARLKPGGMPGRCFRFKMSNNNSPVVPANAGTHNHRTESLRQAMTPTYRDQEASGWVPGLRSRLDGACAPQGARLPGTTVEDTPSHSRGANRTRAFSKIRVPRRQRAQGMPGAGAPAASWAEKGRQPTSIVTTGHRTIRHSLHDGSFRLLRALPGVSGFLATVAR